MIVATYHMDDTVACEAAKCKHVGASSLVNTKREQYESGRMHLVPCTGQRVPCELYELTQDQYTLVMLQLGPDYVAIKQGDRYVFV